MEKIPKNRIDDLINGVIERFEKLETLGKENFPVLCQEIIDEGVVELENQCIASAIPLVVSALLLLGCYLVFTGTPFLEETRHGDTFTGTHILSCIVGVLSGIGVFISIACFVESYLKRRLLKAAPKMYVLRQLKKLVK